MLAEQMFFRTIIRPLLFQQDPEHAHEVALRWAERAGRSPILRDTCDAVFHFTDARLRQELFGLTFPNPVGLAAGFDKNAVGLALWPALGFGFVEVGTVTPRAQPGNDKPRLFRLPEHLAVINRMGFNNDGATRIARRLAPQTIPVGVNLGKQKTTPLERAGEDYVALLRMLAGKADFFVINISSPNTPGLRRLQEREFLDGLLDQTHADAPLLLKLSPDLTFDQLDDALELVQKHQLAGVVATNTTLDHPTPPEGGLSGAPLRARATACIRHIYRQTRGRLPIIGVGGIFTAEDAYEKIKAGASLVEVWTGMIYEGPGIVHAIHRGLVRLLERDGFSSLSQAVGACSDC